MALVKNIDDNVTEAIQKLIGRVKNPNQVVGLAAAECTKRHLMRLNGERANSLGGARSNFYAAAAKSVTSQINPDGVSVLVPWQGMAQRYYGGRIEAKPGHVPTVPARAEAYGHSARDFNDLHLVVFKSGSAALVQNDASKISIGKKGIKNKGSIGGLVFFWLVPFIIQKEDHTVIPTDEEYNEAITADIQPFLESDK